MRFSFSFFIASLLFSLYADFCPGSAVGVSACTENCVVRYQNRKSQMEPLRSALAASRKGIKVSFFYTPTHLNRLLVQNVFLISFCFTAKVGITDNENIIQKDEMGRNHAQFILVPFTHKNKRILRIQKGGFNLGN